MSITEITCIWIRTKIKRFAIYFHFCVTFSSTIRWKFDFRKCNILLINGSFGGQKIVMSQWVLFKSQSFRQTKIKNNWIRKTKLLNNSWKNKIITQNFFYYFTSKTIICLFEFWLSLRYWAFHLSFLLRSYF